MGVALIILTVLILSEILLQWGLPLAGLFILAWLVLCCVCGVVWKNELIKRGDEKPMDMGCVLWWWVTLAGIIYLAIELGYAVIGLAILITGGVFLVRRRRRWQISDRRLI